MTLNLRGNTMLEKISEIFTGIIGTLIFVLLMSIVGFGFVLGFFAIAYYCPCGPLVALFVLFVLYELIRRFISKGLSIGFIIVMTPFFLISGFELLFYRCDIVTPILTLIFVGLWLAVILEQMKK